MTEIDYHELIDEAIPFLESWERIHDTAAALLDSTLTPKGFQDDAARVIGIAARWIAQIGKFIKEMERIEDEAE